MTAVDFLAADALRIEAAHAMARFHQRFDLVICPTTPGAAPAADQPTLKPHEALWQDWAPWTFTFNLTRQPAISVPVGLGPEGMPRGVQVVAALYRDDLALRAARALERAAALRPGRGRAAGRRWRYAPEYENLFPADLYSWVLLRDYDCDGRPDLFTSVYGGDIRVFRIVAVSGRPSFGPFILIPLFAQNLRLSRFR